MLLEPSLNPPENSPRTPIYQPENQNPINNNTSSVHDQDDEACRQKKLFKNLETKVFELARVSRMSPEKNMCIQQGFKDMFSDIRVPNHPPYAWMIQTAIRELNEVGGSSEKDISLFIRKEQSNLPWAHSTLLKHHLEQLYKNGELVATGEKCYKLNSGSLESDPNLSCKPTPSPQKDCKRLNKDIQKRKRNLTRLEEDEFDEEGEDFQTIEEVEVTDVENHVEKYQNTRQTCQMVQGKLKTEDQERPKKRRGRPPKNIGTEIHILPKEATKAHIQVTEDLSSPKQGKGA